MSSNQKKIIKVEEKPNYIISQYKSPPKEDIVGYRKKVIKTDKDNFKRILTLALVKNNKNKKIKTVATSLWREKGMFNV